MSRWLYLCLRTLVLFSSTLALRAAEPVVVAPAALEKGKVKVMVIPVRDEIADPVLYVVRRGLKDAVASKCDVVLLDMDTPGGSLGTTFQILEALEKFPGLTATYVNKDALSAGSFISAMTKEIYFSPNGVIGAAAPVDASGKDIDKTMKQKVVSYMKARVRSLSEGKGAYRAEVISAMIDEDSEFKIGEHVVKKKGELLSLTASEAIIEYGTPPQPLLGLGIHKSVDDLLASKYGKDGYTATTLELNWAEKLASWLSSVKPILMGLGMLALFVEFKMHGSGIFAAIGLSLLGIVFLSGYVAGLSGYEPVAIFVLGLAMLIVEIFVFPGVFVLAVMGVVLMCASLVWSMADLWPNQPIGLSWSTDVFVRPLINLGLGLCVATGGALALLRFLPREWFWDRLVLSASIPGSAGVDTSVGASGSLVGAEVVAVTGLFPTGQVELDGRRYEARMDVGSAQPGDRLIVRRRTGFELVVERIAS